MASNDVSVKVIPSAICAPAVRTVILKVWIADDGMPHENRLDVIALASDRGQLDVLVVSNGQLATLAILQAQQQRYESYTLHYDSKTDLDAAVPAIAKSLKDRWLLETKNNDNK